MVLPAGPGAALVLGVNPQRPLDDEHRRFFRSIAHQVAAALANAELDRAKTEFFANVSHEFRTPLMLMLGPLADVARGRREPDERIAIAHRGALRMLRLVNALLDFSRVEAGRAAAHFVTVDLARLVARSRPRSSARPRSARASSCGSTSATATPIDADADMLENVVLNLISNAYKFTFAGAIDVRVRVGERAVIEVADTGVGLPAHELPRVFERFHRVEGVRGRSTEGSGIGLALVRELVALHGGEISVTSELGKGSTFRVELPRRQAGDARGSAGRRTRSRASTFRDGGGALGGLEPTPGRARPSRPRRSC